ncbi:hypothetical protein pb186bvf_012987 [Paramecium bursaria]
MKKKIENGSVQNVANHTSPIQPSTHTLSLIGQNCIIRHDHLMISKGTKQSESNQIFDKLRTNMDEQKLHEREDQIFEFLGKLGYNNQEGDSSDNCIRHYLKQPIDHIKSNNEKEPSTRKQMSKQ